MESHYLATEAKLIPTKDSPSSFHSNENKKVCLRQERKGSEFNSSQSQQLAQFLACPYNLPMPEKIAISEGINRKIPTYFVIPNRSMDFKNLHFS